jgi:hypothetical protein
MKMSLPNVFFLGITSFCNLSVVILLLSSLFSYQFAFAFTNNPFSKYYFIQLANKTISDEQLYELGGGGPSLPTANNATANNATANNATSTPHSSGPLPFGPVNKLTKPGTGKLPTTLITSTNQSFTTKTITSLGANIITTTTITSSGSTITTTNSITNSGITTVTTTTNESGVTSTVINNELKK